MLLMELTWLSWILAIFGFYYIGLFLSMYYRRWRIAQNLDYSYKPLVCVLIPAHNEESVIGHTIEALLRQPRGPPALCR